MGDQSRYHPSLRAPELLPEAHVNSGGTWQRHEAVAPPGNNPSFLFLSVRSKWAAAAGAFEDGTFMVLRVLRNSI
jgi:hypothetical protein